MSKDKLHVAVDLDDVILDFTGGVRRAVMTEYGVNVEPFNKWEMRDVLDPILGQSWWKWMRQRDWLWSNFPAIPGSIGGLGLIREDGHLVEIVTSKPPWAEHAVWKWLGKWRPPVQAVRIVDDSVRKADITAADILIDDRPENCYPFAEDGRVAILFDRPHNQEATEMPGLYRAKDWHEVVALVRAEAAGTLAEEER